MDCQFDKIIKSSCFVFFPVWYFFHFKVKRDKRNLNGTNIVNWTPYNSKSSVTFWALALFQSKSNCEWDSPGPPSPSHTPLHTNTLRESLLAGYLVTSSAFTRTAKWNLKHLLNINVISTEFSSGWKLERSERKRHWELRVGKKINKLCFRVVKRCVYTANNNSSTFQNTNSSSEIRVTSDTCHPSF